MKTLQSALLAIVVFLALNPVLAQAQLIGKEGALITVRERGQAVLGEGTKGQVKEKAREGVEVARKKGTELAEKARPYAEKAKTATTRALDRAKRATTQAVEKVKEAVGAKQDDPPDGGESGGARP